MLMAKGNSNHWFLFIQCIGIGGWINIASKWPVGINFEPMAMAVVNEIVVDLFFHFIYSPWHDQ